MNLFLSTPSARRATREERAGLTYGAYFYPRPPRGGRLKRGKMHPAPCKFLSTPSARRATHAGPVPQHHLPISIHALREEGDQDIPLVPLIDDNFYPRPPRGGRHSPTTPTTKPRNFYPRPPRGGRLHDRRHTKEHFDISIHALREEGDPRILPRSQTVKYFYPRPPRGGRQSAPHPRCQGSCYFYPRPPRGGRLHPLL